MEAGRFRTYRKTNSNICPQMTDDISTDKAWVKTRRIIDRGLLLHHNPNSECHMAWVHLINTYAEYLPGSFVILMITQHIKSPTMRLICVVPWQPLSLQPVGQPNNMTCLGVEPLDENCFHKLDGKYRAIFTGLPTALLKSFFCNWKTACGTVICACLEVEYIMHGYVWCMPGLDQQKTWSH